MGLYVILGAAVIVVALVFSIVALRWKSDPNGPGAANKTKLRPLTAQLRTVTGLLAVLAGDSAIAGAAIWGVDKAGGDPQWAVAILTSAFTSIVAITTAYFGIRAVSNIAERVNQDATEREAREPRPAP
ncbi:hypothetical protein ACFCWG_26830 [Streptomyces sp. NPDC056390]|uniref:hypothetical protein n=1 Tax=Streptomyces sp. NPDC056390 TaxID=3345806 RepID=UPI0035E01059